MQDPASFELRDATARFDGTIAVDRASLKIDAGEAVAFVGPSGSGKTTALRLLNAQVRADDGRVLSGGVDLSLASERELRAIRSHIGVIPQDLGLIPNLRVVSNVLAGRIGRGGLFASTRAIVLPRRTELERVLAILDRLGIGEKLYHRVDSLSGGEKQRVAIARALYQEAGALLADEPLSALDPARSRETMALLIEVARENQMTLVLSMHDIELAREFVPRLIGLRRGRIVFDCPTRDVADEDLRSLYLLDEDERIG